MQDINWIFLALIFFMYLIFCSMGYLIFKDISFKVELKKIDKLQGTFGQEILKQLNSLKEKESLSKLEINYVKDKLKKRIYFNVFNDCIMAFNENNENYIITNRYMNNFEDVIKAKIKSSKWKDNISKIYISICVGEYKVDRFEVNQFLLNNLSDKDVNLNIISLSSIAKVGNMTNFISGLKVLSSDEKYINTKILIDIINEFYGDEDLLCENLLREFYNFNEDIQKAIIEYLGYYKIHSQKEKVAELLSNKNTNYRTLEGEVKISIIRYFANVAYEGVKEELINVLNDEQWEYRAIAATALRNYKDKCTINALFKSIEDKNWHVRYNSAVSLLSYNNPKLIKQVLDKDDKYSKEILTYVLRSQEKTRKGKVQHLC